MKATHRITAAALALCFILILFPASTQAKAVEGSDICIQYTPQMTEDTFRYLDEIYIEKYPELGLRWEYGMEEDKRIMTEHTNSVIEGCTTDREKADAIVSWIVENIDYELNAAAVYSYDVLYDGEGNCFGLSMLMRDMCRVAGIPAAWGDGFKDDMAALTVQEMQNRFDGHAWCFVYVEGEWILYDPTWGVHPYTDREMIAQDYFLDAVEGITPIYDSSNMPPFRVPANVFAYINGRFMVYGDGVPSVGIGSAGKNINTTLSLYMTTYQGNDGNAYLENPERRNEMIVCEAYRDGWFAYGYDQPEEESWAYYVTSVSYAYENGIEAADTVMTYNGERYLFGSKMCIEPEECRIQYGWLTVKTGYEGQILMPFEGERMESDPRVEMIWESDNPDVATVDQNGFVTNHKEGIATIRCSVYFTITRVASELEQSNPEIVAKLLQEGYEWKDGKLVYTEVRNSTNFGYSVSFENDISRPTEFGKANSGQDEPSQGDGADAPVDSGDPEPTVPPIEVMVDDLDEAMQYDMLQNTPDGGVLHFAGDESCNALSIYLDILFQAAQRGMSLECDIQGTLISLDNAALFAIMDQLTDDPFTIECIPLQVGHLTDLQQQALSAHGVEQIWSIGVRTGEDYIHDFLGGTATVTLPFTPEDGYSPEDYVVYYVSENGGLEPMDTAVSVDSVTFTTGHLSAFALVNTAVTVEAGPSGGDSPLPVVPIVAAGAAVVIIAAVVVLLLAKKGKKSPGQ